MTWKVLPALLITLVLGALVIAGACGVAISMLRNRETPGGGSTGAEDHSTKGGPQ